MRFQPFSFKTTSAALVAVASLSACSSNTTSTASGGSPGPANPSDFLSELDNIQGRVPTSDMPVSGSASYIGAVLLDIAVAGETLRALGDMSFSTTFEGVDANGVAANAVSNAQVSNLSGESSAGDAFDWDLTLTQAEAEAAGFESVVGVNEVTFNAPVVGDVTTRTGALSLNVLGEVTTANAPELGGEGTMLVTMNGSFFDPGGDATAGTAQAVFDVDDAAGIIDISGAGSYFAEQ